MAKPKLQLINGTSPPITDKESVRARLRKTRIPDMPQCPTCAGRTYIEVKTGTLKQRCCAFCFMNEKRIVLMQ